MEVPRGGVHHCESCGYELSGLPDLGDCPECGKVFSRTIPFVLHRLNLTRLLVQVATTAAATSFVVLALHEIDEYEVGPFVLGILAWTVVAIFHPLLLAIRAGERCFSQQRRQRAIGLIFVSGVLVYLAIGLGVIAVYQRLIEPF